RVWIIQNGLNGRFLSAYVPFPWSLLLLPMAFISQLTCSSRTLRARTLPSALSSRYFSRSTFCLQSASRSIAPAPRPSCGLSRRLLSGWGSQLYLASIQSRVFGATSNVWRVLSLSFTSLYCLLSQAQCS